MKKISKERIERAARMCKDNKQAAKMLDCAPQTFSKACKRYGIETPMARRKRQTKEYKEHVESERTFGSAAHNQAIRLDEFDTAPNAPAAPKSDR